MIGAGEVSWVDANSAEKLAEFCDSVAIKQWWSAS